MDVGPVETIHKFAELAAAYCDLIDRQDEFTAEEFIRRLRELLPLLYCAGLRLPELEANDEELEPGHTVDEWCEVTSRLRNKLGNRDLYLVIYDPLNREDSASSTGSLADDLADIWHDLTDGVKFWPQASAGARHEIVWNWKFSFHHHGSYHLVDALRLINWIEESYGIQ